MKRLIPPAEVQRLQLELRINNAPRAIKRGLQDICSHYEASRFLSDPTDVRGLIHSHMHGDDVAVRRWSLKALALISHPEDTYRIVERLRIEPDRKAQSWGVAGLVRRARGKGLDAVCKEAGLDRDTPLLLASRLYAPSKWIESQSKPVAITLNDDELTLEWATFLIGYDRAPAHLFHPRYANEVFLGELNKHDSAEISEYSVWALWERPDYDFRHLQISQDDFLKQPENVRKWLYRLMTQAPLISGVTPDAISDFRLDTSIAAREGLALGVTSEACGREFDRSIVDWFANESDEGVRAILLSGMARRAGFDPTMSEIVLDRFDSDEPGGRLRRKLLAAAEDTPLYPELKKRELDQEWQAQGLLAFASESGAIIIQNRGVINMTKGNNTLNVGGNIQAQNVVLGDMIGSANAAVQNMKVDQAADREVLLAVLGFLEKSSLTANQKNDIGQAVAEAAQKPDGKNKQRLLAMLNALGATAAGVGTIGGGYAAIIELVSKWVG